jgi:hypothetical protein
MTHPHPHRARYKRLKSDVADSDADHFSITGDCGDCVTDGPADFLCDA